MTTKADLEHNIFTLNTHIINKDNNIKELRSQIGVFRETIKNINKDKKESDKEVGFQKDKIKRVHQSVMTILATKYPNECHDMFDQTYYPPNTLVAHTESDELRLLRYLLTIIS